MTAYYNEIDPYAAQWLRNLIAEGHIAPGVVDERDIRDIKASELDGYTQCHFFAGVGVWSAALRRAGWADGRPAWTGSCPCQPFSAAGKRGGFDDERHLWPAWLHLIGERKPTIVLGEQVASKDGYGWLDLVQADLEGLDYACGAVVLPAAGVGAPHGRHRTWFVATRGVGQADPYNTGSQGWGGMPERAGERPAWADGVVIELADHAEQRRESRGRDAEQSDGRGAARFESGRLRDVGGLAFPDSRQRDRLAGGEGREPNGTPAGWVEGYGGVTWDREDGWLGDATSAQPRITGDRGGAREARLQLGIGHGNGGAFGGLADAAGGGPLGTIDAGERAEGVGPSQLAGSSGDLRPGPVNGLWRDADWIYCRDGYWRPVEPGTFPLAHGAPSRVGRLRAYGNAICLEAATAVVEAAMHAIGREVRVAA
jgi:DNA (cytosine-5)-methyltransferase 1